MIGSDCLLNPARPICENDLTSALSRMREDIVVPFKRVICVISFYAFDKARRLQAWTQIQVKEEEKKA
jgi:hypothetical protein